MTIMLKSKQAAASSVLVPITHAHKNLDFLSGTIAGLFIIAVSAADFIHVHQ